MGKRLLLFRTFSNELGCGHLASQTSVNTNTTVNISLLLDDYLHPLSSDALQELLNRTKRTITLSVLILANGGQSRNVCMRSNPSQCDLDFDNEYT